MNVLMNDTYLIIVPTLDFFTLLKLNLDSDRSGKARVFHQKLKARKLLGRHGHRIHAKSSFTLYFRNIFQKRLKKKVVQISRNFQGLYYGKI